MNGCKHRKKAYRMAGKGVLKRCVACGRKEWEPSSRCPKCGWGVRGGVCVRGCRVDLILGKG